MCNNCNQNSCNECTQEVHTYNQCPTETCDCEIVDFSTDCILYDQDDILYGTTIVVTKNTILSVALNNIIQFIKIKIDELISHVRLKNVGVGVNIYKGINLIGEKEIRTLLDSNLINLLQNTNDITISVDEVALNNFIESNQKTYSISNTGTGSEIYKDNTIVGDNTQLNIRKIKSSNSSVSIVQGINDIDITVLAGVVPNGSETKVTAGANIAVTGTGTITTPYILSNTSPDQVVTMTQGGATTVTGIYPNFTISSPVINGSETKLNSGVTTTVTGLGTIASPYSTEITTLQKVITYPTDFTGTNYTITNADNNYEIIINNTSTAVTITVPSGLTSKIGMGFTQKGAANVTYVASGTTIFTPIGLKIKGQYYQTYLNQELGTNIFYLGGNTKI